MSKNRHFTFTSFEEILPEQRFSGYTYLIYQKEKCPSTGKLHYQGAISFPNPRSISGVRKEYTPIHIEIANHVAKARNYCRKSETRVDGPYEFGNSNTKSERIERMKKEILEEIESDKLFMNMN